MLYLSSNQDILFPNQPVDVVDQLQELSIQFLVVAKPFLHILHEFDQEYGLLTQWGRRVDGNWGLLVREKQRPQDLPQKLAKHFLKVLTAM